ncbi:LPXTG cell wall anchor domain-containing protein [Winogradskyella wichelsiae]|uniref:LPXTG cell wall anchor domain-containing protein n=1 Tax=Winogradskyella wichelsiae TaxID=2697007 RepID=UPI003EF5FC3B
MKISFILMLMSAFVFAHQPDLSNVIISKTANNQVILQINSALTAFQQEVNYVNGEGAYKTPEAFQDLVINHFKNSFSFVVNNRDTLQIKNPKVFLGHETKLVAEIVGLPDKVNIINLKNELFKDIYNNQSIIIFLLDDFPKQKFTLNNTNGYEVNLDSVNGTWQPIKRESANSNFLIYVILLLAAGILFYFIRRKNKANTEASL